MIERADSGGMVTFSQATLERALDTEVADWCGRGYRVIARTSTSAQLIKPTGSLMPAMIGWLILCLVVGGLLLSGTFGPLASTTAILLGLGICGVGLLVLLLIQAGRKEASVFLSIGQDGGIIQS